MIKKCVFVSNDLIKKTLMTEAKQGKRLLEPLLTLARESGLPMNILEDKNVWNDAEVHKTEDDLWLCLEGEVKFIYGGKLVNPYNGSLSNGSPNFNELKAKQIEDGETAILKIGDWFYIPAGAPHQHGTEGAARLMIIKLPAKN